MLFVLEMAAGTHCLVDSCKTLPSVIVNVYLIVSNATVSAILN